MTTVQVGRDGAITLPAEIRERHGLTPDARVRIVEGTDAIVILPISDDARDEELDQELREWQLLAAEALEGFPYEEADK